MIKWVQDREKPGRGETVGKVSRYSIRSDCGRWIISRMTSDDREVFMLWERGNKKARFMNPEGTFGYLDKFPTSAAAKADADRRMTG